MVVNKTRYATPEEIAEMKRQDAELESASPMTEPTPEARLAALEGLTDDIVLFMADLIGGE